MIWGMVVYFKFFLIRSKSRLLSRSWCFHVCRRAFYLWPRRYPIWPFLSRWGTSAMVQWWSLMRWLPFPTSSILCDWAKVSEWPLAGGCSVCRGHRGRWTYSPQKALHFHWTHKNYRQYAPYSNGSIWFPFQWAQYPQCSGLRVQTQSGRDCSLCLQLFARLKTTKIKTSKDAFIFPLTFQAFALLLSEDQPIFKGIQQQDAVFIHLARQDVFAQ